MNDHEKIIPISRGRELNAKRLIEALRQKRNMLEKWRQDIRNKNRDKQALYNRELMKPGDQRDYALIADLSAEIEKLDEAENKVFDLMLETIDLLQAGNEQLRKTQDLTAQMDKIIALENTLKGQTEKE